MAAAQATKPPVPQGQIAAMQAPEPVKPVQQPVEPVPVQETDNYVQV